MPRQADPVAEEIRALEVESVNGTTTEPAGKPDLPEEAPKKVSFKDADYTSPGPYPFVCGTCSYLEDYECSLVKGPYQGRVSPSDTCRFYKPQSTLWRKK